MGTEACNTTKIKNNEARDSSGTRGRGVTSGPSTGARWQRFKRPALSGIAIPEPGLTLVAGEQQSRVGLAGDEAWRSVGSADQVQGVATFMSQPAPASTPASSAIVSPAIRSSAVQVTTQAEDAAVVVRPAAPASPPPTPGKA